MSSLTAQILFGVSDTFHDGIRPEYSLFLSENSRAAWVMVPDAVYRSSGEEPDFEKVSWIPNPDTMLEDAMVMIGLYIRKDPELVELAAKFLPEVYPKWMEFYELKDSIRQLFHERCRKIEFRGKLVLTVLYGSTVFN